MPRYRETVISHYIRCCSHSQNVQQHKCLPTEHNDIIIYQCNYSQQYSIYQYCPSNLPKDEDQYKKHCYIDPHIFYDIIYRNFCQ